MTSVLKEHNVLALNFGSASLKAASYALAAVTAGKPVVPRETGRVALETKPGTSPGSEQKAELLLSELMARLSGLLEAPRIVVHRIVHGADRREPVELTDAVLTQLQELAVLAPLHQPPALALVRAAVQRWPDALQVGVFDTSWHQAMPERHRLFAIPYSLYEDGVKRYGFHGLAFQSVMRQMVVIAPELAQSRMVLAHLGSGSSLCAVVNGACVNTTMGMTPLDGMPMATRSGSLDPGALLHLQRGMGLSPDQIDRLLWRESGLKGLSGESGDMRELLASHSSGAVRAIDADVAGIVQGIAAMAACLRGFDVLVFSGGIGANASEIRSRIAGALEWLAVGIDPDLNQAAAPEISSSLSKVRVFVLTINEEQEMVCTVAMSNEALIGMQISQCRI